MEFSDAARHAQPIGHVLSLSGTHIANPVIVQVKFGHALRIGAPAGSKFLDVAWQFSRGAAYAGIVRQTSGYALGIGAAAEGRLGYVEAMDGEEVFFAAFILSFVSMIVLRKGKGDMRGREWIYVAIDGMMGGRARKASLL